MTLPWAVCPGRREACGQCPWEHLLWGIQDRYFLDGLLCPPEESQRWRKEGGKEKTEFSVTLFLPQNPVWQRRWSSLVTCLHKATRLMRCTASPVILVRQSGNRSSFSLLPEEERTGHFSKVTQLGSDRVQIQTQYFLLPQRYPAPLRFILFKSIWALLRGFPGGAGDKEPTCHYRRLKRLGFNP